MIGRRRAGLLVVADEAEGDGLGKLQASGLPIERLGDAADLGGVFGREQAVYVAVARDDAGGAVHSTNCGRGGALASAIARTAPVDGPPLTGRSGARTTSV